MLIERFIYVSFNSEVLSPYGMSDTVLIVGNSLEGKIEAFLPSWGLHFNQEKNKTKQRKNDWAIFSFGGNDTGVGVCGKQN